MRIPLAGDVSTKDGLSNKNARLTNVLAEPKGEKTIAAVRPGIDAKATSSGAGRNMVCFNNTLMNIYGATIYRTTISGGIALDDPQTPGVTQRLFFWEGYAAHVDHLIVTKGEARYTSSYTPTCPIGASDPLWGDVVLYLDFEGANGSTTITDDKGHTITNSGLTLSTAQYSCGTSSLYLSGGGQISIASYTPDFDFGTGDFCIETKLRFFDIAGYAWGAVNFNMFLVGDLTGTPAGYTFYLGASGGEDAPVDTLGFSKLAIGNLISSTIDPLEDDIWYSFAVSRKNGVMRLFMDGTMLDEVDTNTYTLTDSGTVTAGFFDFALMP